jgi:5'(3')-deoxyribonucleotidase
MKENTMTQQQTLYLDMDGVLADFDSVAEQFFKNHPRDPASDQWPKAIWDQLTQVPNLYRNLPLMPRARELYQVANQFATELNWRVAILTAIPKGNDVPDAFQDKVDWAQEHFPNLRVYFGPYSKDKHHHARPGDILVDDRKSNCEEWTQAGGTAVRVLPNAYEEAIDKLKELLEQRTAFKRLRSLQRE